MKRVILAAVSTGGVVGVRNRLPWHLPSDLGNFKRQTTGQAVIMGRRTFESIGKPLPNRCSIVVTNTVTRIPGCLLVPTVEAAFYIAHDIGVETAFAIGGHGVWKDALPTVDEIRITEVGIPILEDGDTFFPEINHTQFQPPDCGPWVLMPRDEYPTRSIVYRRIANE